jgi:hypothetical protein
VRRGTAAYGAPLASFTRPSREARCWLWFAFSDQVSSEVLDDLEGVAIGIADPGDQETPEPEARVNATALVHNSITRSNC